MKRASFSVGLLCLALNSPAKSADLDAMNERFATSYLPAAVTAFVNASQALEATVATRCAGGEEDVVEAIADTATAWAGLGILHLPLVQNEGRNARVLFHPDPRAIGQRQLRRLLKSSVTLDDYGSKSVAVRGLGTLDRLAARLDEPRVCKIAVAVADDLAETAREISIALPAFAMAVRKPGENNDLYRTDKEAAAKIVGSIATSAAAMRDLIVVPTIGETAARSRWKAGPLRQTNGTFLYLTAQATGIVTLLGDLAPTGSEAVERARKAVIFEARNLEKQFSSLSTMPLESLATTEDGRSRLRALVFGLDGLEQAASRGLMQALGLQSGFNALDGD